MKLEKIKWRTINGTKRKDIRKVRICEFWIKELLSLFGEMIIQFY